MNPNLQPLINTVQGLPLKDQAELIGEVLQLLQTRYGEINIRQQLEFTYEILENHHHPATDIRELKAEFWPEDESADDIIDFIYEQRKNDRLQ